MENTARWLPGSLLVLVALIQLYLSVFHDLSPWKGGGFGMFAVVDAPSARTWSVGCVDASGTPCLAFLPRDGQGAMPKRFETSFRAYPSAASKEVVASYVAGLAWQATSLASLAQAAGLGDALRRWPPQQARGRYLEQRFADSGSGDARSVRPRSYDVDVWRMRFDASSLSMTCVEIGGSERARDP